MMTRRTVGSFGEVGILDIIRPYVSLPTGRKHTSFGDDCAVLELPPGEYCVHTADMLVEGTHFPVGFRQGRYLGIKAAVSNLSDLAAAGAVPRFISVCLTLPSDLPVRVVSEIYNGLQVVCDLHKCRIAGGDVTRGERLAISIAATGSRPKEWASCRRSDCRPGDFVYVSGSLGMAKFGLDGMLSGRNTARSYEQHFHQEAEVALGTALAKRLDRVGMIDVSDGLYNELHALAKMSGVGFEIAVNEIPTWDGLHNKTKVQPWEYALFSGEEYKLLWSCSSDPAELAHSLPRILKGKLHCIGRVEKQGGVVFRDKDGKTVQVQNQTFRHFAHKNLQRK